MEVAEKPTFSEDDSLPPMELEVHETCAEVVQAFCLTADRCGGPPADECYRNEIRKCAGVKGMSSYAASECITALALTNCEDPMPVNQCRGIAVR
jgi:hypothetical protein